MNPKRWSGVFVMLLLYPGFALSQTNWPGFMPTLVPGVSVSSVAAIVPLSVVVEPPKADVPPDKARWSCKWSGWLCQDQVCDTKLIVEKMNAGGATIIYAFASSNVKPFTARVEAQFAGGELQAAQGNGATLAYRMREAGDLEFLWRREGRWVAGILSKDK